MSVAKKTNDHVVILPVANDGTIILCRKCNTSKHLKLPMEIGALVVVTNLFTKIHSKCAGRNCYSCDHLEWVEAESFDPSGFVCNKRYDTGNTEKQDDKLLKDLESHKYLRRQKICFEGKNENAN